MKDYISLAGYKIEADTRGLAVPVAYEIKKNDSNRSSMIFYTSSGRYQAAIFREKPNELAVLATVINRLEWLIQLRAEPHLRDALADLISAKDHLIYAEEQRGC